MPPRSGLISTHFAGLYSGVNAQAGTSVVTLAVLNFSDVPTYVFADANATDEWLDFSTSPVPNTVGSETLTNDTGTMNVSAIGVWDGTDWDSVVAWESGATVANPDSLIASGSTAGDSAGEDLAFRIDFKTPTSPGNADVFLGKHAGAAGWFCDYALSTIRFFIRDESSNFVYATATALSGAVGDNAWHWIKGYYDADADLMYLKSDIFDEEVTKDCSSVTGSLTNGASLQINGAVSAASTNGLPDNQVPSVSVAVGATAQAFYASDPIVYGSDPTSLLSTRALPNEITVPIDAVNTAVVAPDHVAIAYDAAFSDAAKMGLWCDDSDGTEWRVAGNYVSEDKGEITSVFVVKTLPGAGQKHYVFDTLITTDQRSLYIDENDALIFSVRDSVGVLVAEITLGTVVVDTEYTAVCQWDKSATLTTVSTPVSVRAKLNELDGEGEGVAFTSGDSFASEVCLGSSGSTANTSLEGLIQSLDSKDAAGAMSGTINYTAPPLTSTLTLVAASADPAQLVIDLMDHDTKPDLLWIQNEAGPGTTELIAGLADLSDTAVTREVDETTRLGADSVVQYDANNDKLTSTHASLDFGTGSFAMIDIFVFDSLGTHSIVGKHGSGTGFYMYTVAGGQQYCVFQTASGNTNAHMTSVHSIDDAQVHLLTRNMSTLRAQLHTREGSGPEGVLYNETMDTATEFSLGRGFTNCGRYRRALTMIWKGANAEAITNTMRIALQTALGLD